MSPYGHSVTEWHRPVSLGAFPAHMGWITGSGRRKHYVIAPCHAALMDPVRLGHSYRALRLRARWRQSDLGARAGVSASTISRIERGRLDVVSVATLRKVAEALDATLDIRLRWNGEGLDRLLDQAHAGLVEQVVQRLRAEGWATDVEVSFAIRGERGSSTCSATTRRPGSFSSPRSSRSSLTHRPPLPVSIERHDSLPRSRGRVGGRVAGSLACWSSATPRRRVAGSTHSRRPTERLSP
jgi:transcriptional regulator with XRE-family HTH domain